jgi:tetratricopeptide (TPR) repeat protein
MEETSWLPKSSLTSSELLPLFRVRFKISRIRRTTLARVLALYADSIVSGHTYGSEPLQADFLAANGASQTEAGLRSSKRISWSDVQVARIYRPSILHRQSKHACSVQIQSSRERICFNLEPDELEHVLVVLHERLGERLERGGVKLHNWWLSFVILLLVALIALFAFSYDGEWLPLCIALGIPLVACTLFQVLDHIPVKFLWERIPKTKPEPGPDKSHRKPLRSFWLGTVLKVVGFLILIYQFIDGQSGLLMVPAALLMYLGYRLALRSRHAVQQDDTRPPILYLRSFLDDGRNTLAPDTPLAYLFGLRSASMLPAPYRYLVRVNPIRILRLLLGIAVDTEEEQMGRFLSTLGPFVAIGKPGERFSTPGASRTYVTNDEWQNVVVELAKSSRIVVLQPSSTEGIWWEVEQVFKLVERQRILLCMVNFRHKQNEYERFRIRAESFLQTPLPKAIGCIYRPVFLYFTRDGEPQVQQVRWRSPFVWPLVGDGIDMSATLNSFLSGLEAEKTPPPTVPKHQLGSHTAAALVYLVLLLAVGLAASVLNSPRPPENTAQSETADGPVETIEGYTELIRRSPDNAVAYRERGWLHLEAEEYERALADLTAAIRLNPDDAESHLWRGATLADMNRPEEAILDYRKALALNPELDTAWNNLGFTLDAQQQYPAAVEAYSKAIELVGNDGNASYFENRGVAYLHLEDYESALVDFNRAFELGGATASLRFFRGYCLTELGRFREAVSDFDEAEKLNATWHLVKFQRGRAYLLGQAYEQAYSDFTEYLESEPQDIDTLFLRSSSLERGARYSEALADLNAILESQPDNPVVIQRRANLTAELGDWQAALKDVNRGLELAPESFDFHFFRALIQLECGDLDAYRSEVRAIDERFYESGNEILRMLILQLALLEPPIEDRLVQLDQLASENLETDAANPGLIVTKAASSVLLDDREQAVQLLEPLLQSEQVDLNVALAWLLQASAMRRGDMPGAEAWFTKASEWISSNAQVGLLDGQASSLTWYQRFHLRRWLVLEEQQRAKNS